MAADMQTDNPSLSWIASGMDRSQIRLPGTIRAQSPAATLEMASQAAAKAGVTRVADITRLDTIGIPTYQAIRPLSRTLAVSQGKGVTPDLAKVSAVMESVEMWHVEQPMTPAVTAAPRDLGDQLGYDIWALPRGEPSVLHDGLVLDWLTARSLADGSETVVPVAAVRLSLERRTDWNAPTFAASTNGLASGNTLVEAVLHGLYEVIERDAMTAAFATGDIGVPVDPRTMGSPVIDAFCAMIERAGVTLQVRFVASPTGLPCLLAWVACPDYPTAMFGFGCHVSTEIALSRAITEAAQTRLGYISGARDDVRDNIGDTSAKRLQDQHGPQGDIRELMPVPAEHDSLLEALEYTVKRTTAAFGHPPLVVDLTRDDMGVPVAKVVAPGAREGRELF
jgi:ribosomal protein S12 methylthiotransferase accessory factor